MFPVVQHDNLLPALLSQLSGTFLMIYISNNSSLRSRQQDLSFNLSFNKMWQSINSMTTQRAREEERRQKEQESSQHKMTEKRARARWEHEQVIKTIRLYHQVRCCLPTLSHFDSLIILHHQAVYGFYVTVIIILWRYCCIIYVVYNVTSFNYQLQSPFGSETDTMFCLFLIISVLL